MDEKFKDGGYLRLEKRLSRLEQSINGGIVNYYIEKKEGLQSATSHVLHYGITVFRACTLLFKLCVRTKAKNFSVRVKFDDSIAFYAASALSEEEFLVPLTPGNKDITVELFAQEAFEAEWVTIETTGAVDYPAREYFLTVLNETDKSVVCLCFDGEVLVKRYIDGDLTTVVHLKDVKSATVCRVGDYYSVFFISSGGDLKMRLYDVDSFEFYSACTLDGCVSSACAHSGDPACVYAVKGNSVYKYTIDSDLNLVTQATDFKAWRVSCEPSISDYIVVTDYNGKVRIINTQNNQNDLPTE